MNKLSCISIRCRTPRVRGRMAAIVRIVRVRAKVRILAQRVVQEVDRPVALVPRKGRAVSATLVISFLATQEPTLKVDIARCVLCARSRDPTPLLIPVGSTASDLIVLMLRKTPLKVGRKVEIRALARVPRRSRSLKVKDSSVGAMLRRQL